MRGLVEEAQHEVEEHDKGPILDLVIVAGMQRIEHYEIAAYGVARAFAECLEFDEDAHALIESLAEESEADDTLTNIAMGGMFKRGVNEAAAA